MLCEVVPSQIVFKNWKRAARSNKPLRKRLVVRNLDNSDQRILLSVPSTTVFNLQYHASRHDKGYVDSTASGFDCVISPGGLVSFMVSFTPPSASQSSIQQVLKPSALNMQDLVTTFTCSGSISIPFAAISGESSDGLFTPVMVRRSQPPPPSFFQQPLGNGQGMSIMSNGGGGDGGGCYSSVDGGVWEETARPSTRASERPSSKSSSRRSGTSSLSSTASSLSPHNGSEIQKIQQGRWRKKASDQSGSRSRSRSRSKRSSPTEEEPVRPHTPDMGGLSTWGFAGVTLIPGGDAPTPLPSNMNIANDNRAKPRPFTPMKNSDRPMTSGQRDLVDRLDPHFVALTETAIDDAMNEMISMDSDEEQEDKGIESVKRLGSERYKKARSKGKWKKRSKGGVDGGGGGGGDGHEQLVNPADMLKKMSLEEDDDDDNDEDEMDFYKRFLEEQRAESRQTQRS